MKSGKAPESLKTEFSRSVTVGDRKRRRKCAAAKTFSVRLSEEERHTLRLEAGNLPLGTYMRKKLLGDDGALRKPTRSPRKLHRPSMDQVSIARVLALLGRSDLHRSMKAIAQSAVAGTLYVTPDIEEQICAACADIGVARALLMKALGTEPELDSDPGR